MDAIAVSNFRSLEKIDFIKLLPLTILLGRNSSGKSTFLRILPLLKQSVEGKTKGILSLYGLVDFGDFSTLKTTDSKDDYIELKFQTEIPTNREYYWEFRETVLNYEKKQTPCEIAIRIKQDENKSNEILIISKLDLSFEGNHTTILISDKEKIEDVIVNGRSFGKYCSKTIATYNLGTSFLPAFLDENERTYEDKKIKLYQHSIFFRKPAIEALRKFMDKKIKSPENRIFHFLLHLPIPTNKEVLRHNVISSKNLLGTRCCRHFENLPLEDGFFSFLYDSIILYKSFSLMSAFEIYMKEWAANISYTMPLRAYAERYYRTRALSVTDVAPDGSNIVEFINNLSYSEKKHFTEWTKRNFNFVIDIEQSIGHQSIFIEEKGQKIKYNITDMGFGFSQIIPIITQLWSLCDSSLNERSKHRHSRCNELTYVIEQPELHLHPAFQIKLLKAFVKAIELAEKNKIKLKIIIETHSETFVNALGALVEQERIKAENVGIVLFDKKDPTATTQIHQTSYDSKGILQNWPIGFFQPDDEVE